ncbi:alkaline phosphatase family protein [Methylocapsa palsarum]|uniref:Phosphoesterase family protein n=1 Tax=Methylocapsa palsarum TaxID=1612308 RepID=A0A1I3ZAK7_9HYPH|nr:alkaline phosphatase family protein [Methylocapsa palsarum]SFK41087.1 Phosphoesterase family protein [Methylocapsa palsarum]
MKTAAKGLTLFMSLLGGAALAAEGPVPANIPRLDHVFLIIMENHGYDQIVGNPNAPFINTYAKRANSATNYFAVGHPSLTNYLEIVGGSNFGNLSDNYPDWHSVACQPNLKTGVVQTDNPATGVICPIHGSGADAAVTLFDATNEVEPPATSVTNIDGIHSIPVAKNISGKTIADQLVAAGRTWKSYQENLPLSGADGVNVSDGVYTNKTDFTQIKPALTPPLTSSSLVYLYAVKHNPFAYFKNIQDGANSKLSLAQIADFDGPHGLYADLGSGEVPSFSLIAPNQCNDQHGRGNAGAFCNYDPSDKGTQDGLNPALIYRGDVEVERLVKTIHKSTSWREGRNAIVVVWDENDYSATPNVNKVLLIVETNYGVRHHTNTAFNTHFSLLKTIEGGFGLPCLNHACDPGVLVLSDLFAVSHDWDHDGDND